MGSRAPNWAEQWGEDEKEEVKKGKMGEAKAKASAGMEKAKAAAMVGAMKLKSGSSSGLKWFKTQYNKRTSSSSSK